MEQETHSELHHTTLNITDPAAQLLCDLLSLDEKPLRDPEAYQQVEWDRLLLHATQQNLAALLHKNIKLRHIGLPIPSEILKVLQQHHIRDGATALLRLQTLEKILMSFQEQNIPVIALKGIYLAEAIYNDDSVRSMADIDLLIHPYHLDKAEQILTQMGYKPWRQFWTEHEMKLSHEMPAFLQVGEPSIELHWTLLDPGLPFSIDLDKIWERALPVTIAGVDILGLAPEDLLLHLCLHAPTQHHFRNALRMIYDIALTVNQCSESMNWQEFEQRAFAWKAERAVYLMLSLARQLFSAPVPPVTLQTLQSSPYDSQALEIVNQLLIPDLPMTGFFAPNLAVLLNIRNPWQKTIFILRRIFITPTELSRRYPVLPSSPRVLIYYFKHLRDIFRKHLLPAMRLVKGDRQTVDLAQVNYDQQELERKLLNILTKKNSFINLHS